MAQIGHSARLVHDGLRRRTAGTSVGAVSFAGAGRGWWLLSGCGAGCPFTKGRGAPTLWSLSPRGFCRYPLNRSSTQEGAVDYPLQRTREHRAPRGGEWVSTKVLCLTDASLLRTRERKRSSRWGVSLLWDEGSR